MVRGGYVMWWFLFFVLMCGALMGAASGSPRPRQDYPENEYDHDHNDCGGCDE